MNKFVIKLLVVLVFIVSVFACKSKKAVVKQEKKEIKTTLPTAKANLLHQIKVNENTFGYYNSRGTVNYHDNAQNIDLNVDLVMEKDRYVYMNITALLGISVARIFFTGDSVCILDILHKKCFITNYEYIRKISNVAIDLKGLQQVFVGNAVFTPDETQVNVDTVLNYVLLNTNLHTSQWQTTFYGNTNWKANRNIISDKSNGREVRIEYTECYTSGANCFPKEFNINIRAEKTMECKFNLDYFAFDKKKEVKFVIPKNFQIIRM